MKILKNRIMVGSIVELLEDIDMWDCIYTAGHRFNVVGSTARGWDLEDNEGNKVSETAMIESKLKWVGHKSNPNKKNGE